MVGHLTHISFNSSGNPPNSRHAKGRRGGVRYDTTAVRLQTTCPFRFLATTDCWLANAAEATHG